MRHRKHTVKLSRTSSHRKAMFRNMVTSLLAQERIETTVAKAKEARRFADRMVTLAKRGTLHARRQALAYVMDEEVVAKLFSVLGPRYADRNGGYTRVIRTGFRQGDGADLAILELVDRLAPSPKREKKETKAAAPKEAKKEKRGAKATAASKGSKQTAKPETSAEDPETIEPEEKAEKKPRPKRRKKAAESE
jgi:large subunit ribosomal protein L17